MAAESSLPPALGGAVLGYFGAWITIWAAMWYERHRDRKNMDQVIRMLREARGESDDA